MVLFLALAVFDAFDAYPKTVVPWTCPDDEMVVRSPDAKHWWRLCEPDSRWTDVRVLYARQTASGAPWLCENEQGNTWTTRAPVMVKYMNATSHAHAYLELTSREEACMWTYIDAH